MSQHLFTKNRSIKK